MLSNQVIHSLLKPFPFKCNDLEYILESTNNIKELSFTYELIVNSIFGLDTGLNLTENDRQLLQWPFKLINKFNYATEFNSVFNFLSTDSLFWSIVFKLSNLQINFKYPICNLPTFIKYRIDNGLSILTQRLDTMNFLNLNALEYYLVNFVASLLQNDSNRAPNHRSNYFYNEFNGKMDLNCVYSELLENYLHFFLPINTRDVNFPQLASFSQEQQLMSQQQQQNLPYLQHSLIQTPQRLLKTSYYEGDLIKQEASSLFEQTNLNLLHKKLDRTNDLQKIDFFMKLLVDLWLCPFSDGFNERYFNTQLLAQIDIIFEIKLIIKHVFSFSNANFTNASNRLLNSLAIVNTSDDRPRSKARFDTNNNNDSSNFSGSYLLHPQLNRSQQVTQTPIDDLRMKIVDIYLRKPVYKFLKYNIENWTLSPTIKFLIETWLFYIQPWCSPQAQEEMQYEQFTFDIYPSASVWSEFVHDNLFTYVDLYQIILRRLSLLDLTVVSNVQLLYRICYVFSHGYLIKTVQDTEVIITQLQRQKLNNSPTKTALGSNNLLRSNIDRQQQQYVTVVNMFKEFNKQISNYKSIVSSDSRRVSSKLVDSLVQTKKLFEMDNEKKQKLKSEGFFVKTFKTLFNDNIDTQNCRISHLNPQQVENLNQVIDECIDLLDKFYQAKNDDDPGGSLLSDSMSRSQNSSSESEKLGPAYETSNDGVTMRLSPRGRSQMLNASCKANLEKVYDPDTALINEFESRPVVYFLRFITDFINYKFQNQLQSLYNRNDVLGSLSQQLLYGPRDYKNKVVLQSLRKQVYSQRHRVQLSLRKLSDYRFIFYFLTTFFLIKFIFGLSYVSNLIALFLLFFCYILIKAIFS